MKTMKWLCAGALIGGCVDMKEGELSGSSEQAIGPGGVVVHTSANGGMAGFGSWDQETWTSYSLNAYENGSGPSKVTYLSFGFWGPDPATLSCDPDWNPMWGPPWCATIISVWGMGQIPNGDFTVAANGDSASLHTTTGSTFFVQSCSGWTCTTGGAYTFDVAFTGNGIMHMEQSGTRFSTMGTPDWNGQILGFRESGTVEMQGAYVSGMAFGLTISNAFGQIMHTTGGSVTRDLVRVTP